MNIIRVNPRVGAWALVGVVGCALTGCCTNQDKSRVRDIIEKFEQQGTKNCEKICDHTMRDQCFADLNDQLQELMALEIGYLDACGTGDNELIKDILRQIRDIVGGGTRTASAGLGSSQTGVHNAMDLFADGDSLQIAVSASVSGQPGSTMLASGAGGAISGSAALAGALAGGDPCGSQGGGSVSMSTIVASTQEYEIASGSVTLDSAGSQWSGTVTGSFTIAWENPQPDGSVHGVPTIGQLRVGVSNILDVMLNLDASQPQTTVSIDGNGNGLLAFKAVVTPVSLPSTLVPEAVWLELPMHFDSATGIIECGTGGAFVSAETIAPRAPFPVADCNDDMLVTQDDFTMFAGWLDGGDPRADATHDGVVNEADFDYFYAYWTFEVNR